jgi:hypothetical protein
MVVMIKLQQQVISMQTNMNLLIRMNMCITSKRRGDGMQPFNTPTLRENFRKLYLRINGVLP